ncbi:MAG: OmpA family protein [Bacteroidetes bacterium]|nr:OmpA family protein [Bacteroidota bacterium]
MIFRKNIFVSVFLFCIVTLSSILGGVEAFAQQEKDTVMIDGQMYIRKAPKKKIDHHKFIELFTQGNLEMMEGFNDTALHTFHVLHEMDPLNANVNFKIGQLYLSSSSEKTKAVDYLEAAAPKATRNYIPDEPSEKRCPELVYYLLGQAYHLTYRFDEAIAMYEKFGKAINLKDLAAAKDLKRKMEMSKTAQQLVSSPVKCTITNLGDSVNSEFPDYGAVITADESQLFFTSRRFNAATGGNDNRDIHDNYYEDIWVCDKNPDGSWSEAKPLSTHVNSWYNEAVVGISADGQQLLYYKDDKGGSIYYSKLEGDQWSYGYMLGTDPGDITDINSPSWEPSACLSPDGNTLYFVSDRPGGFGGRDIYRCVKLPTGRWSKGTNLGPTINTEYDEDAPFMHPDGVTLFFSSNGHKTMGGFDVFFSVKGDSGWYPPQNMGYPINTTDDDIFYVMSTDGKRAYLSSVRPEGKGEKDIYLITIPQRMVIPVTLMKGHVSFAGKKDSMMSFVTISATDMESGQLMQEVHPNTRTMKYILPLNPGRTGKTYTVKYEADGFRPYTEIVSVTPEGEYKEIERDYDFKNLGAVSVYGKVKTRAGELIPGVKISAKDNTGKKLFGVYAPKPDGSYSFDLPGTGGESYSITYEADGFITMNESLDLPKALTEFDFKKDVIMETAKMLGTISVSGTVTDKIKNPVKNSRVVVIDNKTAAPVGTFTPNDKGEYYFNLQRGNDYNVSYEADGYLFQSENINVPKEKTYSEIKKNIVLEKIKKGAKIVLNNIFFDSGKATLRKESKTELDKVEKLITENPSIKVEIGGHTDDAGKKDANLKLSQARAEAVVNELIVKGADRLRLTAQGYGDAQPVAPNKVNGKPNAKNMQLNRRVEFKILEN